MFEAVLFDLDGTLLPMDTEEFLSYYIKALAPKVETYLPPEAFARTLFASTAAMVESVDPQKTNQQVFIQDFFQRTNLNPSELMPVFENFYRQDFPSLHKHTFPSPLAKAIVDQAINRSAQVAIATNPVFPFSAIAERMRWAGLHEGDFTLITTYENMHFCKPQLGYYQEILALMNLAPEKVLMVGNDTFEDLIAQKLGIATFLVEDFAVYHPGQDFQPSYRGSLKDLHDFIQTW